ncbi:MAG: T9SS type A sorting domain-containing protein [Bacteroidales bacterium]|nr:T9SS type A sorting domain-containing protein [Bacteroidales bacterium]
MAKSLQNIRKIAALTVALLAISLGVNAQTWYIMGEYIWSPPHPQGTFEETHYQAENVEIGGMEYHTIYVQGEGTLLGAYRNEDNQVYYCKWNGSSYDEEVMLYDYDLEEGDFFNDSDEHPMQVTEVTTITDNNGVSRKKHTFQFIGLEDETEYWIEGVGSSKGFVNSGNYTPTPDGAIFHLLCYHVGENLIYVNPVYNNCDVDDIEENGFESNVSIYPNPTNEVIKILNDNNLSISGIEIIDMMGRTLMNVENCDEINVSELPEGQYFVKIYGELTIVKKLFISK